MTAPFIGLFSHELSPVDLPSSRLPQGRAGLSGLQGRNSSTSALTCWVASGKALPLAGYAIESVGLGVSELQSAYHGHAGAGWGQGRKHTLLASLPAGAKGITHL